MLTVEEKLKAQNFKFSEENNSFYKEFDKLTISFFHFQESGKTFWKMSLPELGNFYNGNMKYDTLELAYKHVVQILNNIKTAFKNAIIPRIDDFRLNRNTRGINLIASSNIGVSLTYHTNVFNLKGYFEYFIYSESSHEILNAHVNSEYSVTHGYQTPTVETVLTEIRAYLDSLMVIELL